jgi:hypothetical protein
LLGGCRDPEHVRHANAIRDARAQEEYARAQAEYEARFPKGPALCDPDKVDAAPWTYDRKSSASLSAGGVFTAPSTAFGFRGKEGGVAEYQDYVMALIVKPGGDRLEDRYREDFKRWDVNQIESGRQPERDIGAFQAYTHGVFTAPGRNGKFECFTFEFYPIGDPVPNPFCRGVLFGDEARPSISFRFSTLGVKRLPEIVQSAEALANKLKAACHAPDGAGARE